MNVERSAHFVETIKNGKINKITSEELNKITQAKEIVLKINPEGELIKIKQSPHVDETTITQIKNWLIFEEHELYADDYYILMLEDIILKINLYELQKDKIFIGEVHKNDLFERLKFQKEKLDFYVRILS